MLDIVLTSDITADLVALYLSIILYRNSQQIVNYQVDSIEKATKKELVISREKLQFFYRFVCVIAFVTSILSIYKSFVPLCLPIPVVQIIKVFPKSFTLIVLIMKIVLCIQPSLLLSPVWANILFVIVWCLSISLCKLYG